MYGYMFEEKAQNVVIKFKAIFSKTNVNKTNFTYFSSRFTKDCVVIEAIIQNRKT